MTDNARWAIQVVIDLCGYAFVVLFWSSHIHQGPFTPKAAQRLMIVRGFIGALHLIFFIRLIVLNLQSVSSPVFANSTALYLSSVVEIILLVFILQIIIEFLLLVARAAFPSCFPGAAAARPLGGDGGGGGGGGAVAVGVDDRALLHVGGGGGVIAAEDHPLLRQ